MPTSKFVSRLLQTAILVLLVANAAWATFPGKNGRLVFVMSVNGGWQLFTINPDGTDLQQLTNLPPTGFPVLDPVYSPDGSQVVFSHDMTGAVELYVVNADGTDLRQVTHDNGENLFPIWSPDGLRILFSRLYISSNQFFDHHLASINPDGSGLRIITRNLFDDYEPAYTPDGSKIVFASSRGALISALWVGDSEGSQATRLTAPELEGGYPDVSPDGRQVAFDSHESTKLPPFLWIMRTDGSHLRRLTSLFAAHPAFAPDNKKIAFVGGTVFPGTGDLYLINPDGSGLQLVLHCPEGCLNPHWSSQALPRSGLRSALIHLQIFARA